MPTPPAAPVSLLLDSMVRIMARNRSFMAACPSSWAVRPRQASSQPKLHGRRPATRCPRARGIAGRPTPFGLPAPFRLHEAAGVLSPTGNGIALQQATHTGAASFPRPGPGAPNAYQPYFSRTPLPVALSRLERYIPTCGKAGSMVSRRAGGDRLLPGSRTARSYGWGR